MNAIIELKNIQKSYKIYERPNDILKELFFRKKYYKDFCALNNINLSIKKGENIGIIGRNGSGKSTLLKIISSILKPTKGEVCIRGKVSAILELGAGFNPEYSGRENIYVNGMIFGYSRQEMDRKVEEITAFADLGEFIDQPVKTYSSGMYARLAFSVAINVEPDILIVDEALSVGDMGFQHKCIEKMKKLIEKGISVLFVSHDTHAIKSLCQRCVYLENGKIKADGEAAFVTDLYLMDVRKQIYNTEAESNVIKEACLQPINRFERYGTGEAQLLDITMRDEYGNQCDHFSFKQMMCIEIKVKAYKEIEKLACSLRIRDKNGVDVTGVNTSEEKCVFPLIKKGKTLLIKFSSLNVLKHDMSFSVGVTINEMANDESRTILDCVDNACVFKSVYEAAHPVWYMYYQQYNIEYKLGEC